jgi:hypothetical protein
VIHQAERGRVSDRTERPGPEGRRGLQSVVQLYLSRPPRRPHPGEAPEESAAPERPLEEAARDAAEAAFAMEGRREAEVARAEGDPIAAGSGCPRVVVEDRGETTPRASCTRSSMRASPR